MVGKWLKAKEFISYGNSGSYSIEIREVSSNQVIFMIIVGFTWFDEIYNLWTLLGVCLILLGLVYNTYIKSKNK